MCIYVCKNSSKELCDLRKDKLFSYFEIKRIYSIIFIKSIDK